MCVCMCVCVCVCVCKREGEREGERERERETLRRSYKVNLMAYIWICVFVVGTHCWWPIKPHVHYSHAPDL